ncbi:hypothetical protein FACS1894120_7110 [Clostridia bacterium]|nr:hypothetical protein FACS1894120_7110 [Clostridia bacterium]
MKIKFEWDEEKNDANLFKHGVTFEKAATVFKDKRAIILYDDAHSQDEDRFIVIGREQKLQMLTVCHCWRYNDTVIRIISARKANAKERKMYEEQI